MLPRSDRLVNGYFSSRPSVRRTASARQATVLGHGRYFLLPSKYLETSACVAVAQRSAFRTM